MCGIAGYLNLTNTKPNGSLLKKMTDAISYRGPDDEGQVINGQLALGSRRLAVIDLTAQGHMPMWDTSGRYLIAYNGEVYNFKALRKRLESQGVTFRSTSDTEVILELVSREGVKAIQKLRGMFAFVVWDRKEQKLILARDHFGIKPLYYCHTREAFIFGSELKTILLHPNVKRNLNAEALSHYFSIGFGVIPSPHTIFEGIFKLPPASYAVFEKGSMKITKYWDIADVKPITVAFDEAKQRTEAMLISSVKEQLVSDVPLGTFLSGGLDSSLISAISAGSLNRKLETFSIGFEEKDFDESTYSNIVSKHLSTKHYHKVFSASAMLNVLPGLIEKLDEPFADASILPTYLLSQFTREHVTVSLSGDGGDELFAGYPTYLAHRLTHKLSVLPQTMIDNLFKASKVFGPVIQTLPLAKHSPNLSVDYKLKRFFNAISSSEPQRYVNAMGPMSVTDKDALITDHTEVSLLYVERLLEKARHFDSQTRMQYLDFLLYMGEDCLTKTDRASSYNSLEVRVPFLNVELAEFVFSLPSRYKLHGFTLKHLLKEIGRQYLPDEIVSRPKKGFGIPIHRWLRGPLQSLSEELLNKECIKKQGLFQHTYVSRLKENHELGLEDNRMVLWNLILFQLWYKHWFKN